MSGAGLPLGHSSWHLEQIIHLLLDVPEPPRSSHCGWASRSHMGARLI